MLLQGEGDVSLDFNTVTTGEHTHAYTQTLTHKHAGTQEANGHLQNAAFSVLHTHKHTVRHKCKHKSNGHLCNTCAHTHTQ